MLLSLDNLWGLLNDLGALNEDELDVLCNQLALNTAKYKGMHIRMGCSCTG